MAGVASLSIGSGRHPSPHRARSRRTPSAARTAQSWYQSALSLRRHPALARSTPRDSILTKRVRVAPRHQPADGSVDTGQPASRQRSASSLASRHARARTARAAIRATPTGGAQVDCVLLISCHLVGVNRSSRPAIRPPKPGVRGACHRSSTCTTTCTPSCTRTAPAAADPDSRSSPSSPRPSAVPTRRSTASASPRPCRARRRAPRHRSAPSTRPPGTSACRSSPCISCPGREQLIVGPALEQGLSSLRSPPESVHRRHEPTPSGQGFSAAPDPLTLLPSGAPRGAARRLPVRKMAALLSSCDGPPNLDRVRGN